MNTLDDTMRAMLAQQLPIQATVSKDGLPDIGPKRSLRIYDDSTLIFNENTGGQTLQNIQDGSQIAIAVIDRAALDGYRFVGRPEIFGEGTPAYDNALAFAVHRFFNERDFVYMHTPIITGSDAEGAGEMFRVTTLDPAHPPRTETGEVDFREDFFGKPTNLTVSGQLEGELAAMALGNIYTFGPTFRAENSNTTRHLAEFWMIEPEMAFYELEDNMDLAEDLLKYVIRYALDNQPEEIEFLKNRLLEEEKSKPQSERSEWDLVEKLHFILHNKFERITYTEAIDILKRSKPNQKKQFKYPIEDWGADLQSEHERYLVEKHFKKPVILTDYPREIKSFYMKQNEPDAVGRQTVRAMDILFPGIGEMVGGSQREENLDKLLARMAEVGIPAGEMDWFLDTRRFGTAPHSGFGVGFERLVLFVTGMTNIRDVIPFPRTPKNAAF